MKYLQTLLLIIVSITTVWGQQEAVEAVLTNEQNAEWISDFPKENLEAQLTYLQNRFSADQNVYFTFPNPHGKSPKKEDFSEITSSRPLYILNSPNAQPWILPSNPSEGFVRELLSVLNPEDVASVELHTDIKSQAIYGARARHGVIIINILNEDHLKKLKEVAE